MDKNFIKHNIWIMLVFPQFLSYIYVSVTWKCNCNWKFWWKWYCYILERSDLFFLVFGENLYRHFGDLSLGLNSTQTHLTYMNEPNQYTSIRQDDK